MGKANKRLIKVSVRNKAISKGRHSVYLDFWPPISHPRTGKPTRREFLGLYTFDSPGNFDEQQHNKDMMIMAQAIRNRRVLELNKSKIYSDAEPKKLSAKEALQQDFLVYFRSLAEKRGRKDRGVWMSAFRYLRKFTGGHMMFAELNERKIVEFKEYIESRYLAQNTKAAYFTRLKSALKQAFRDGILQEDLNLKVSGIKEQKTPRVYLTLEELNKLAITPCKDDQLKRASLFSALTGLKFSDIQSITWHEVQQEGDTYFLKIRQIKTDKPEKHPISKQAFELLGPSGGPIDSVFNDLYKSVYNNSTLSDWLEAAGIKKKISFQAFRHSYAVNQLFLGTDIYTVSKMLGHQDLTSTMVYAKIADELKDLAANRIKLDI